MPGHDIPLRPYDSTAARDHLEERPRPKTLTVDFHAHMRIPAADDLVKPHLPAATHTADRFADKTSLEASRKHFEERMPFLTDVARRLPDMDRMQIDVMATSCNPRQFHYMAEPSLGHEASQIVNDGIAANIKDHPDRHVGLATVPLQDTDLAIKELRRAISDLGFHGVQIGANVAGEELSVHRLDRFWEECQALDIPVFIHPTSFASERLAPHHFMNLIGNPLDTTVAVHYLIFDGVMERFPDLKIVLSHGGAFAAAYGARMDHGYGARADCRQKIHEKPSTYLKRFYVDTIVFSVDQLAYLIDKFGVDHVLIGTDYPFDMGEYDPVEHVYQVDGLSEADREKICGLNALALMGLEESRFRS